MERRDFLKAAGVAALVPTVGGLLAACGGDTKAATQATLAPTTVATKVKKPIRKVKLGFIALTDCSSIVMAKELGYFAERDLDVSLVKQASWPATRDNLLNGQIDGAHCLFGMPFSVATGIGGTAGNTALKIAMTLSNNGQAITLSNDFTSAGYANLPKV